MTTLTAPVTRQFVGTSRVAPAGEIDLSNQAILHSAIISAISAGPNAVEVDLDHVTFCDCTGIRVLLQGQAEARASGIDFRVVNAHGLVLRVLRILGLDQSLMTGLLPP